jgi:hypothetical protein
MVLRLGLRLSLALLIMLPHVVAGQAQLFNSHVVIAGHLNACTSSGTTNTYACTLQRTITAYETQACYQFTADTANTGAATVNFSGLGAKAIKKQTGSTLVDLAAGDIAAGDIVQVCYDGTVMQRLGGASASAQSVSAPTALAPGNLVEGVGSTTVGDTGLPTTTVLTATSAHDVANKRIQPRYGALSALSGTVDPPNAGLTGFRIYHGYGLTGTLTIPCPTGTPLNGQDLLFILQSDSPQTVTFTTGVGCFAGAANMPLPTGTTGDVGGNNVYDHYGFTYNSHANAFVFAGTTRATGPCTLAVGCTGSALSDPGGHRLLGWDDTDNQVKFQTLAGCTYDAPTDTWTCGAGGGFGVRSFYVPAAAMEPTGACMHLAPAVLVTTGPRLVTIQCTDADADSIEFDLVMPDGWDGGTLTMELAAFSLGNNTTEVFEMDFAFQCVSSGDTPAAHSTTGEQAATITWGNAANREQHATTAAITGNGPCAAGDHIYVRGQVDATATTTSPMTDVKILGVKVEWTRNAND